MSGQGHVARLREVAEERMAALHVPGLAFGVLHAEREEVAGVGVIDLERPRAVDADSVFAIGSITKTFTASAIVALATRGQVDLDAPVRSYVPELALADPAAAQRVTVRHLLTHTGGWLGEQLPEEFDGDDALARAAASCEGLPQISPPGDLFSYNNVGFIVAGRVVEAASGRRYEDVVREQLLKPLGMRRTDFVPLSDANTAGEYTVRDGAPAPLPPWSWSRSMGPVGGLRSTVLDLLRYARCQLGDGPAGLSAHAATMLRTPTISDGTPNGAVGLSWFITDRGAVRVVSHGGATVSHMSTLTIVPEQRFAITVLTNGANGAQIVRAIVAAALELYLGVAPEADRPVRALSRGELEKYEGDYRWPTSDIELISSNGGLELRLRWKGAVAARPPLAPMRLGFWDVDKVVCSEGAAEGGYGDFIRDAMGSVRLFRWGGRTRPRVL